MGASLKLNENRGGAGRSDKSETLERRLLRTEQRAETTATRALTIIGADDRAFEFPAEETIC